MSLDLLEHWLYEESFPFSGWDFSHLEGRWQDEPLPWDYDQLVRERLKPTDRLLDMGTGGGEYLLSLKHPYHLTAVTEGWEPNIQLINKRLAPLGIDVKAVDTDNLLPFPDDTFNLVINRHESYDIAEVWRILKPGSLFITQQVGGTNNETLSKRLIPQYSPELPDFHLALEKEKFIAQGFSIQFAQEFFGKLEFLDVGAIVYYAKVLPWEFPGFSVQSHFRQLMKLQETLETEGVIRTNEHRFLLIAKKPEES